MTDTDGQPNDLERIGPWVEAELEALSQRCEAVEAEEVDAEDTPEPGVKETPENRPAIPHG